jgi:hypothetical protein
VRLLAHGRTVSPGGLKLRETRDMCMYMYMYIFILINFCVTVMYR